MSQKLSNVLEFWKSDNWVINMLLLQHKLNQNYVFNSVGIGGFNDIYFFSIVVNLEKRYS